MPDRCNANNTKQTPQRSDSVKKPKIKLNTSSTPKANGTPSKKAESATKPKSDKKAAKKAPEPEMTPAEKRERKQVRDLVPFCIPETNSL